jgi:hypothetical protein
MRMHIDLRLKSQSSVEKSFQELLKYSFFKRVGGIEPPSLAWKAKVLPLNYTRRVGKIEHGLNQLC